MTTILLPIHKRHADAILDGRKTVEVRKSAPQCVPATVLLYVTKPVGLVIGSVHFSGWAWSWPEHVKGPHRDNETADSNVLDAACLTRDEFDAYMAGSDLPAYLWQLATPVRFDAPLTLDDLGLKRAPQSWRYLNHSVAQLAVAP